MHPKDKNRKKYLEPPPKIKHAMTFKMDTAKGLFHVPLIIVILLHLLVQPQEEQNAVHKLPTKNMQATPW